MGISIGKFKEKEVDFNLDQNSNNHIFVTGRSGEGKTNFIKNYISHADADLIIAFDYSQSFDDMLSVKKISVEHIKYLHNYFEKLDLSDITMISDIIWKSFDMGSAQKTAVIKALNIISEGVKKFDVEQNIKNSIYAKYVKCHEDMENIVKDWALLAYVLDTECGAEGRRIAGRFFQLIALLYNGRIEGFDKGIIVVTFPDEMTIGPAAYVELILWKIWMEQIHLHRQGIKRNTIFVLDECQNLDWTKGAIAEKILSEGRKFSLNMVLSTQFIKGNFRQHTMSSFSQCALRVMFCPPNNETRDIAKLIDSRGWKNWTKNLQRLRKGECIIIGNLTVGGRTSRQTIIIKTPEYKAKDGAEITEESTQETDKNNDPNLNIEG